MTRRYRDEATGFIVTTNDDTWAAGYTPPAPEPVEQPEPRKFGDLNTQGANRTTEYDDITPEKLNDFAWYQANKERVKEHLNWLNGL